MERLSRNFMRYEFACKGETCCGLSAPVHPDLVAGLQELRDCVGKPVRITSGFRCRKHNATVSPLSPDSYHTKAMAADIMVDGMTGDELAERAWRIPAFQKGGVGVYANRLHVDVRTNGPARWRG